ncbi:isoniazid response ATPase/transcriptional regulator IniR [Candidatus Mycolicibacterium alkanivorans]|uniref:Isoniazid response ATPase/transcriptional regulator IniR n=1 Tax=Candidatus Mycolicibacterium alkanivorans TaxID=2954114 RepID=A0ABS9YRF6_9MYCO|nr:isoniazid response ATPase/transcriptional regulator IniR [Candidatus Mycolicibacterium alkanivorans]MCI4673757.1 isoniazid response ATPase/transcriptional regulator IniR [Candidatus Mycolicibacterium alkanivorans]
MADSALSPSLPPTVKAAVDALAAAPSTPVKLLMTGGLGTGKSTALGAVRDALRDAGVPVASRVPQSAKSAAAVVIDDAHLLTAEELSSLTELAGDPSSTVVVAAQPRDHDESLRALMTAIERERPRITLEALAGGDISRMLADPSGHPPRTELVTNILLATAGIPFLVSAALGSARPLSATSVAQSAFFALIERLRRLDEHDLDSLLIASLSSDLGAADIAAALDVSAERAQMLMDRARATGLFEPSHSPLFLRSVHRAVAQIAGNARHHDIEAALLRSQVAMSTLSPTLALGLAEHGVRDTQLAETLRRHAGSVRTEPATAARLYRAAVDAGAADLRPQLADALALSGESQAAAIEADALLSSADRAEQAVAVRVAASVAAHNGNYAQAAELFTWLGPYPDAVVSAAAAIVLTGVGDVAGACNALAVENAGPPTAAARAARTLADGLLLTISGPYAAAAAKLGQAMVAESPTAQVLPDSPAALVTLAALHGGDPVRARSVISRAVRAGDELHGHRRRLLLAWTKMQDGQLAGAGSDLAATDDSALQRRDALWAAALRTAIARRGGDTGAVHKYWNAAMEVLAEYSVDLFSLLPLGELWMAAARIRKQDRLAPVLEQAFGVLAALGNPPAWSVPLHWAGVHAGILANDPAAVAPHGQALTAAAAHEPFARALAGAGRAWLRVLAGQVEPDEVNAAARSLAQFGLTSDATRLAGQAALQASDPKVSGLMLQVARDLKLSVDSSDDGATDLATESVAASTGSPRPASSPLSDREREVAELLLLGMPYRDIGAQLFISAKTVEHHVARIRRRLGAESRSEMLSMLRAILAPEVPAASPSERG